MVYDKKAYMKAYRQRPDVKAKRKAYRQRPDVKAMGRAYDKSYRKRHRLEISEKRKIPSVAAAERARHMAYYRKFRRKILARHRVYSRRPEVRERKRDIYTPKQYIKESLGFEGDIPKDLIQVVAMKQKLRRAINEYRRV